MSVEWWMVATWFALTAVCWYLLYYFEKKTDEAYHRGFMRGREVGRLERQILK